MAIREQTPRAAVENDADDDTDEQGSTVGRRRFESFARVLNDTLLESYTYERKHLNHQKTL